MIFILEAKQKKKKKTCYKKVKQKKKKIRFLRAGLEPATYGFQYTTTVHRSTSWAIEGTLKDWRF